MTTRFEMFRFRAHQKKEDLRYRAHCRHEHFKTSVFLIPSKMETFRNNARYKKDLFAYKAEDKKDQMKIEMREKAHRFRERAHYRKERICNSFKRTFHNLEEEDDFEEEDDDITVGAVKLTPPQSKGNDFSSVYSFHRERFDPVEADDVHLPDSSSSELSFDSALTPPLTFDTDDGSIRSIYEQSYISGYESRLILADAVETKSLVPPKTPTIDYSSILSSYEDDYEQDDESLLEDIYALLVPSKTKDVTADDIQESCLPEVVTVELVAPKAQEVVDIEVDGSNEVKSSEVVTVDDIQESCSPEVVTVQLVAAKTQEVVGIEVDGSNEVKSSEVVTVDDIQESCSPEVFTVDDIQESCSPEVVTADDIQESCLPEVVTVELVTPKTQEVVDIEVDGSNEVKSSEVVTVESVASNTQEVVDIEVDGSNEVKSSEVVTVDDIQESCSLEVVTVESVASNTQEVVDTEVDGSNEVKSSEVVTVDDIQESCLPEVVIVESVASNTQEVVGIEVDGSNEVKSSEVFTVDDIQESCSPEVVTADDIQESCLPEVVTVELVTPKTQEVVDIEVDGSNEVKSSETVEDQGSSAASVRPINPNPYMQILEEAILNPGVFKTFKGVSWADETDDYLFSADYNINNEALSTNLNEQHDQNKYNDERKVEQEAESKPTSESSSIPVHPINPNPYMQILEEAILNPGVFKAFKGVSWADETDDYSFSADYNINNETTLSTNLNEGKQQNKPDQRREQQQDIMTPWGFLVIFEEEEEEEEEYFHHRKKSVQFTFSHLKDTAVEATDTKKNICNGPANLLVSETQVESAIEEAESLTEPISSIGISGSSKMFDSVGLCETAATLFSDVGVGAMESIKPSTSLSDTSDSEKLNSTDATIFDKYAHSNTADNETNIISTVNKYLEMSTPELIKLISITDDEAELNLLVQEKHARDIIMMETLNGEL